ncbi:MAG: bifunctional heptose 7-phosphate kinase/heptose 1-phosphate adenyltransferase [Alphaproteobacteria bacterium]|nr:bifunctional heptose 7-phosphate kinase/heptose 1-phosphate adenyltransferase [Alphaproteobacteria bacterium]
MTLPLRNFSEIIHLLSTDRATLPTVLCVGDVILDRYLKGHIERVSREAPVPIVLSDAVDETLGGGGNVHKNLCALGINSHLISVVGADNEGNTIEQLATQSGGCTMIKDSGRDTVVKTRIVCDMQQLLRVDRERPRPLSQAGEQQLIAAVDQQIASAAAVILSDYALGIINQSVIRAIVRRVEEERQRSQRPIPILVDPKGTDFGRYRGVDFVTPNRQELGIATGMPTETDEEIIAAARNLITRCGIHNILATRSEKGMTLVTATDAHHLPTEALEVFDVAGAGDTVIASFATALVLRAAPQLAVAFSNRAAGIVVGKHGTATATPAELLQRASTRRRRRANEKLLSLPMAQTRIAQWRREGLKVGFTNGCFDLLHPGHLQLLQESALRCDRLVVGMNGDSSVTALKGDSRPIQHEATRAMMLSSLSEVDMVIIFNESHATVVLEAICPDVYLKGGDYESVETQESRFVRSYHGAVDFIPLASGYSTTSLIERIKALPATD